MRSAWSSLEIPASDFINVVASTSSDDLTLNFDATKMNTLSANLTVRDLLGRDGATDAYIYWGSATEAPFWENCSAYIDNTHYAAIDKNTPGALYVCRYFVGKVSYNACVQRLSGQRRAAWRNEFLPRDIRGVRPDDNLRLLRSALTANSFSGAPGAHELRSDLTVNPGNQYVDNVHLGWWVAGAI